MRKNLESRSYQRQTLQKREVFIHILKTLNAFIKLIIEYKDVLINAIKAN